MSEPASKVAETAAEHTPGPWTARGGGSGPRRPDPDPDPDMLDWSSGVDCVAPFTENEHGDFQRIEEQTIAIAKGRSLSEAEANARLIAAAPDLLEALRHCLREHGGFTIKGETERMARAAIAKAEGRS